VLSGGAGDGDGSLDSDSSWAGSFGDAGSLSAVAVGSVADGGADSDPAAIDSDWVVAG